MKKVRATLGFIFSKDLHDVLLIRKQHPEWQAGKINGLGGKCFAEEPATACMSREVMEESCLSISADRWTHVTQLLWNEWQVDVFATKYEGSLRDAETMTDEEVEWFSVTELPAQVISNLQWLIPLAIDQLTNTSPPTVARVSYSDPK